MGIYGIINNEAHTASVVTTILIAMVAMLFTAISYGKMARIYPSAGSAYTYVGKEIHPALVPHQLGNGDGLHTQSSYLHGALQQTHPEYFAGRPLRRLGRRVCRRIHGAESALGQDLGADQRDACGRG